MHGPPLLLTTVTLPLTAASSLHIVPNNKGVKANPLQMTSPTGYNSGPLTPICDSGIKVNRSVINNEKQKLRKYYKRKGTNKQESIFAE